MPLDTRSIGEAMRTWPQPPDVLGAVQGGMARAYQLQGMQQAQQVRQLQLEEAQRQEFERQNLGQAIRGTMTTDPVTGQQRPNLTAGLAQAYTTSRDPLALFKVEQDYTKSQADSRKTALEAHKLRLEGLQKQSEYVSGLANGVLAAVDQGADPEAAYQRAIQEATAVLGPEMIQGLPPTFDRGVVTQFAMKGLTSSQALQAQQKVIDQQLAELRLSLDTRTENRLQGAEGRAAKKAQREEQEAARQVPEYVQGDPARSVAIDRLMQQRGLTGRPPPDVLQQAEQDILDGKVQVSAATGSSQIVQTPEGYARVNPRTGQVEMVQGPQGPLQPKPTTEESRAASFATGVQQAHDKALQLEQKGLTPNVLTQGAQKLPLGLGNYLLPAEHQQYQQAILQFAQNLLRKESGAAISQSEYEMTNKTYFPQPGDGAEVIKQKQAARAAVVERLQREGARATPSGPGGTGSPAAAPRGTGGGAAGAPLPTTVEEIDRELADIERQLGGR